MHDPIFSGCSLNCLCLSVGGSDLHHISPGDRANFSAFTAPIEFQ